MIYIKKISEATKALLILIIFLRISRLINVFFKINDHILIKQLIHKLYFREKSYTFQLYRSLLPINGIRFWI